VRTVRHFAPGFREAKLVHTSGLALSMGHMRSVHALSRRHGSGVSPRCHVAA